MWNPFNRIRRRGWLPRRKYGRLGVTTIFAAIALAVILITGWLLDLRGSNSEEERIAEIARNADDDPVASIANAVRGNRLVFLSDIHSSHATKRLAASAIKRIVATAGLDAVALEVPSDLQPVIDQYLHQSREDASILLTNGRTIREPGPATRDFLDIYRTIWNVNQQLGADQRIHIIAADLPGWPPARSLSPAEAARKAAERDAHMQKQIQDFVTLNPRARILVFISGFHTLKSSMGELQTGGTAPVRIAWLASRFARTSPEEVYSFLVDAPGTGVTTNVTNYVGTTIDDILQRTGVNRTFVTPITAEFNEVNRPLVIRKSPGLSFEITPRDYRLSDVADAYIHLR